MSNDDLTKITTLLAKQDERLTKLEDAFLELYKRGDEHFRAIEEKLEHMPDRDHVYSALDTILKNQETDEQERLVANHQLDRHEQWIEHAADKINVSYDPAT